MIRRLTILSSILLLSVCYGTIINVPGDYSTIQTGIDAASDGDEIRVAQGIWKEMIDFEWNDTTSGVGSDGVVNMTDLLRVVSAFGFCP